MTWWDTDFQKRMQLTVSAAEGNGISAGYSLKFNPTGDDAAEIYEDCLANGDDLRVVYWNGSSWVELDRDLKTFSSSEIEVWFAAQAVIAGGESDDDYYLYYDNAGAGSPPADLNNVYWLWDDFEDGNTVGWAKTSGATFEAGTAYKKNGDYGARLGPIYGKQAYWSTPVPQDGYVCEAWIQIKSLTGGLLYANGDTNIKWRVYVNEPPDEFCLQVDGTGYSVGKSISQNVWYHLKAEWIPGGNVKAYFNGELELEEPFAGTPSRYVGFEGYGYTWVDDVKIRLRVATEPTVSGESEESIEVLSESISTGVDDACDDLPKVYRALGLISAGVDDACDDFPTAEEGAMPYSFIF